MTLFHLSWYTWHSFAIRSTRDVRTVKITDYLTSASEMSLESKQDTLGN